MRARSEAPRYDCLLAGDFRDPGRCIAPECPVAVSGGSRLWESKM